MELNYLSANMQGGTHDTLLAAEGKDLVINYQNDLTRRTP
jgi:hypothetical protein